MIEKEIFLIGLIINILGNYCFNFPNQNRESMIVPQKKDSVFCVIAKQLPDDDGPNKSPYKPRQTTDIYMSNATGTTGPTGSGTASPSPSPEA